MWEHTQIKLKKINFVVIRKFTSLVNKLVAVFFFSVENVQTSPIDSTLSGRLSLTSTSQRRAFKGKGIQCGRVRLGVDFILADHRPLRSGSSTLTDGSGGAKPPV